MFEELTTPSWFVAHTGPFPPRWHSKPHQMRSIPSKVVLDLFSTHKCHHHPHVYDDRRSYPSVSTRSMGYTGDTIRSTPDAIPTAQVFASTTDETSYPEALVVTTRGTAKANVLLPRLLLLSLDRPAAAAAVASSRGGWKTSCGRNMARFSTG